eukprot:5793925-Pleurochrysis_carterae.AAC.1
MIRTRAMDWSINVSARTRPNRLNDRARLCARASDSAASSRERGARGARKEGGKSEGADVAGSRDARRTWALARNGSSHSLRKVELGRHGERPGCVARLLCGRVSKVDVPRLPRLSGGGLALGRALEVGELLP